MVLRHVFSRSLFLVREQGGLTLQSSPERTHDRAPVNPKPGSGELILQFPPEPNRLKTHRGGWFRRAFPPFQKNKKTQQMKARLPPINHRTLKASPPNTPRSRGDATPTSATKTVALWLLSGENCAR